MEKIYSIENLDCANCAAKAEAKIRQIPGIEAATITFATMQLRLTAENPDALLPLAEATARQIEPEIRFFIPTQKSAQPHRHVHNDLPFILLGAGLFALGVVLSALSVPIAPPMLFISAYILLGWEVLSTAVKNILRGNLFDENFLMSIATLGAFAIGEFAEAVGVMLFYRVGAYFEHKAMERSRSQIMDAADLRPEVVHLASGETIAAEHAKVGDEILVRPGDRIPLDGVILQGESRINTAPVTGESVPVGVKAGDSVLSGCINGDSLLIMRVEKPLSDSFVTRILHSVESAAASKPKMDRFLTRFSQIYTPIVVALALFTAVIPSLIGGNWEYWVYTALSFLVMSCPCALVLSVPLAFFSGIGIASKQGIVFKGGVALETMAQIKTVVLDKTGTVTKGDFSLQSTVGENVLALCAACEQHSTHPIAKSILRAAEEANLTFPAAQTIEEIPGHGICATIDGKQILCGNEKLLSRFGIDLEVSQHDTYGTQIYVAENGTVLGFIIIADTIKPDARAAICRIHQAGIATAMFTGDKEENAMAVAKVVGIQQVYAQLLPQEKLDCLQQLRKENGAIMFVGDGINDAPVLAGSDVSAAMGNSADAALEAADVVFMTGQVSAIAQALDIAKTTRRIAWQNIVFALAVKAIVILLGLLGGASMWAAVFADSGTAMLCVCNAIRLLYRKKE